MRPVAQVRRPKLSRRSWIRKILRPSQDEPERCVPHVRPPVAEPTGFALNKGWIDDIRDVPARIDLPVRIVVIGDLNEFALAPVVLSQEYLPVAIEADQQKHVATDVRCLVKDVADYFAVGEDGILQGCDTRVVAKGTPTRRPIASVHPRQ